MAPCCECFGRKPWLWIENVGSHCSCSTCSTACWTNRSITVGIPSSRLPPSGFSISTRLTGCALYVPLSNCSRISFQCPIRYCGSWTTRIPSTPGLPLLALTRLNARFRFSVSHTASICRSLPVGGSVAIFATSASVPFVSLGASPFGVYVKASSIWVFCRFSLMSRCSYYPLHLPSCEGTPFGPSVTLAPPPTLPSADFCATVRAPLGPFSLDSETPRRSPEVSSIAFDTQPPGLRFALLMDTDFAVQGLLVQRSRLIPGSCSSAHAFAPRFFRTLLAVRRPCASLALRFHQPGQRTLTS